MSDEHVFEDESIEKRKQLLHEQRRRERDREVEDVKKVLSMPEGRRFMWRLMSSAGVFRSGFTGDSKTFFNEGKRDIGLLILTEVMNANSGAFAQMQNEFVSEQKKKKK